jgi:dihydropteroate synthase
MIARVAAKETMTGWKAERWQIRDRVLTTDDHTLLMGIVNVTPDSFSDGGTLMATEAAIAHGRELWRQGADIVDVGGESTRPGATPVPLEEELERVLPVVAGLVAAGVVVSIDTMKSAVAAAAVAEGAHIINDVTALADPAMAELCAVSGVGVVLMHMQGDPQTMQLDPRYENVTVETAAYLEDRVSRAQLAGVAAARICIDPGIGFGKTLEHNLELLASLDWMTTLGYPLLVGTSRKGFLGTIVRRAGFETNATQRDAATAATVALAVAAGAAVVRVHNVGHALQAARTADAIVRASQRRF